MSNSTKRWTPRFSAYLTFTKTYGGKVLRFGEVTLDMVDLTGGVINDRRM
ncbi:MAG: hypothetical protein IPP84_04170 [Propionivibrio sp.]|nr:hypothetical protein [Propionivibrio sp.]MBL0207186.1 hypothetical protein [Propionivibrio sp.]